MILTLFAPVFAVMAFWHNCIFLPPYADRGIQTTAVITELSEHNMQRRISMNAIVEHTPEGTQTHYRHYIEGGYLNRLTIHPGEAKYQYPDDPLKIGDIVDIIYLPDQPEGRAILPNDLNKDTMPPLVKPIAGFASIGLWLLMIAAHIFFLRHDHKF